MEHWTDLVSIAGDALKLATALVGLLTIIFKRPRRKAADDQRHTDHGA